MNAGLETIWRHDLYPFKCKALGDEAARDT